MQVSIAFELHDGCAARVERTLDSGDNREQFAAALQMAVSDAVRAAQRQYDARLAVSLLASPQKV